MRLAWYERSGQWQATALVERQRIDAQVSHAPTMGWTYRLMAMLDFCVANGSGFSSAEEARSAAERGIPLAVLVATSLSGECHAGRG